MRAEAIPNNRYKHYGTDIRIYHTPLDGQERVDVINIWMPYGPPVDGPEEDVCDSHYESAYEKAFVAELVRRINA